MEALARASAERTLALDPNDQSANAALAIIDMLNWRWPQARQTYEGYYHATGRPANYYDWFTSWVGGEAEAIEIAQRGVDLEPLDGNSHWSLGLVLSYAGQYETAADALRHAIDLAPTQARFHSWLAFAEIGLGNPDETLRELQFTERLLGDTRAII
jgi:tetratricopeptide (TPR) repeat protein